MPPPPSLTPSEKLFLVEAAYGRAMLRAHGIEKSLATWLICSAHARDMADSSKPTPASIKRLTLGTLVERFIAEAAPSRDLMLKLRELLDLRNNLAHRISDQLECAALQIDWHEHALVELNEAVERIAECRQSLLPHMEQARTLAGISEEEVVAEIRRRYPYVEIDA